MSLYPYRVFLEIVESGSFVKAAEKLNLTPSAVSHSLKSLESEFGFRLFRRNRAGAMLTSEGNRLLPYIRALIQAQINIDQEIDLINGNHVGSVSIGMFSSVASNWFIKILHEFRIKNPGIDVIIRQGSYENILHWLEGHEVEMAFTTDVLAENLNFSPLRKDPLICVAYSDFIPSDGKTVSLNDLSSNRLIINRECSQFDARDYLRNSGIEIEAYYESLEHQVLFAMVREGMGLCIVPELVASDAPSDVNKFPLSGNPSRIIGITYSDPDSVSPASKLLFEEISKFVQQIR